MHYAGALVDGTPFDNSYDRGVPISFQLGAGRVIQGWEQGIKDMCVGEKRRLLIPSELGYGKRGVGPIPANSDLCMYLISEPDLRSKDLGWTEIWEQCEKPVVEKMDPELPNFGGAKRTTKQTKSPIFSHFWKSSPIVYQFFWFVLLTSVFDVELVDIHGTPRDEL